MRKLTLTLFTVAMAATLAFAQNYGARSFTPDLNPQKPIASQADVKGFLINETFDNVAGLTAAGWNMQNLSTPVGSTGWFQATTASTVFPPYEGTGYIGANFNNTSGTGTIDNWLITPVVDIKNGDVFTFWSRIPSGTEYPDRLQLRMSSAGASTNVADFTVDLLTINPSLITGVYPKEWTQFTATISGVTGTVSGRFAFRYWVTSGGPTGANSNYIGIDLAQFNSVEPPAYAVTFTVTDGTNPIEGANVAINSQNLTTNASGVATINLVNGAYPYTVTKAGFVDVTGTATVAAAALPVSVAMTAIVVQPNVTLTVTNLNPAWDNIWVKSAVDNWTGRQMVKNGNDWTYTYTAVANGTYAWGAYQADGSGTQIAWLAPSPNPEFTVAAPNVTGTTSFTIPAPGATFPVTFTVTNLNPDHTLIKIKGSFNSWATVAMDPQPNNVWTKTFQVEAGTYEWGVVNQDDGWLIEGPNPSFTVSTSGAVTGQVTYTIPGLGPLTFNFNVDMSAQIDAGNFIPGADVLELVGNFNGWPGSTVPVQWRLTDANEDGIYSLTTGSRFNNKQTIQFKVRLNGNWDTNELPGMVPNRYYTFLGNITNVYHCVYGVRGTTSVTQAMPFAENFENASYESNFPPVNWSMVDYDQDGNVWHWGTNTSNGAIRSQSWLTNPQPDGTSLTPENFIITPRINLAGATNPVLSYRVAATSVSLFAEKYQVYVSKLGNDVAEFVPANMLIDEILTTENGGWNYKTMTFNLASYIGEKIYIAFVHKGSTGKDRITFDDIMVQEATSIISKPVVTMSLYPNPASDNLNIVASSNIRNIRVMNLLGQQVLSIANVGNEFYTLDIAKLNAGIYIVSITDANGAVNSSRFIKK